MSKKEIRKNFKKFLKENDFLELFCEIMEATTSEDQEFILRVARKVEKFHMDVMKYAEAVKEAKKMSECTSAKYLTALTMRAFDKGKPAQLYPI